jgi:RNA polymerase sigma-70 factor (ECF subfamily)
MSLDFSSCTPDAAPPIVAGLVERIRPGEAGPDLLVQWVQFQDERSLALLMAAHRPMVAAVCRRILGHQLDAEEVTEEVFADFAQEAGSIRGQPGAWLRRAATHRAWRRNHRSRLATVALRGDEEELSIPSEAVGGEEERRHLRSRMAMALTALSATERQAVIHHFYHDRSPAEIAGTVGISAHAVRKRLGVALDHLRQQPAIRRLYAEAC